jgi:hypothetical protein
MPTPPVPPDPRIPGGQLRRHSGHAEIQRLAVIKQPAPEFYICEPGGDQAAMADMIADELRTACGILKTSDSKIH